MATAAAPRSTLFGPYLLHEELGRGGMAVVYRAESLRPETRGRAVALKRLHDDIEFDLDFDVVRSFIEEARLATRFHHPNIARTHSLGKIGSAYFIEMEYVHGPTLLQLVRQSEKVGAVPLPVIGQLLIQICDALEHVHTMCDDSGRPLNLVHRDVSLSNIMIAADGVVKLIDFGIVKGHSQVSTQAGVVKGKIAYIAPEYLQGALDRRADLFALGVIAHELLTNRRLFQGTNDLDTLTRVREMRVPPPSRARPDVSPALDRIVLRALARDPDRRWQTAGELRAALVEVFGVADPSLTRDWVESLFRAEAPISQVSSVIATLEQPTSIAVDLASQLVSSEPVPNRWRAVRVFALAALAGVALSLGLELSPQTLDVLTPTVAPREPVYAARTAVAHESPAPRAPTVLEKAPTRRSYSTRAGKSTRVTHRVKRTR